MTIQALTGRQKRRRGLEIKGIQKNNAEIILKQITRKEVKP